MIKLKIMNYNMKELRMLENWFYNAMKKTEYCDGNCKTCSDRKPCEDFENGANYIHELLTELEAKDFDENTRIAKFYQSKL